MPTADSTRRDWLWRAGWRASGPSKISRASLAGVIPPTSAAGSLVVSFTPVRHRSPVVTRIVSGSAWSARPTNTNLHAVDGCPPRRPGSGPGAAPTRSLDAYRASLRGRATRSGPPGPLSQFLSHSPPSGAVHRCSPSSCLRSSRTVADVGERRPTVLESVLGATPQEYESPNLRHA